MIRPRPGLRHTIRALEDQRQDRLAVVKRRLAALRRAVARLDEADEELRVVYREVGEYERV